jgi:hypothetical protein
MKYAVFWLVTPCGSVLRLLVTANAAPSLPILVTLIIPQKRRFLQEPLGVTSQKTAFFRREPGFVRHSFNPDFSAVRSIVAVPYDCDGDRL